MSVYGTASRCWVTLAIALGFGSSLVSGLSAQDLPGFNLDQGFGFGAPAEPEVTYTAELSAIEGTQTGTLSVTAKIQEGWHTFSLTSPAKGPQKTTLSIANPALKLVGSWQSDVDPHVYFDEVFKVDVEEHKGSVTWSVPVQWESGFDPQTAGEVATTGQACTDVEGACVETSTSVAIVFTGFVAAPAANGEYRPASGNVVWRAEVVPATAKPGDKVELRITGEPANGFHLYGWAAAPTPKAISADTLFAFTKRNGWRVAQPVANPEAAVEETGLKVQPTARVHHEPVTWTLTVQIPADAKPESYRLEGLIGYQTCSDTACDLPSAAKFSATVVVGQSTGTDKADVTISEYVPASGDAYKGVVEALEGLTWGLEDQVEVKQAAPLGTILYWVGISFLAGLILNVMPCVLPVIGLKIMSLVSQAGSSRFQIFHLNLWLSIGIISVFLVLATLAVVFGLAWSEQFTNQWFVVVLTSVVFVFGLSFFGLWEVPIPGFAGSSGASKLAEREGAIGAFFKGALSTVLATPCGGPLMVPAIVFAVSQPPVIAYGMFAAMGIGMASPYLMIGLFPATIRWLPRPGDWMITFKELMGFAMLATVVFLVSILTDDMRMPMGALLVVLGFACWWVGRVPVTAELSTQAKGWAIALIVVAAGGFGAFKVLGPAPHTELAWVPFDQAVLEKELQEGKPVFVDFTANWCFTCRVNEGRALNTTETKELFEQLGVIPMKADKTLSRPDIDALLKSLGNEKALLPFYAVYSPGAERPLVFGTQTITHDTVKEKLAEAGIKAPEAPGNDLELTPTANRVSTE